MFLQTIYYPVQLFAQNMYGTSLDVFVDCDTYDTEEFFVGLGESTTQQNDVPYLDVSASYNDGEVIINVVNRNKEEDITTDILCQTGVFLGNFEIYEVNGPNVKAQNDFGKNLVSTKTKPAIKAKGEKITYTFPAHSITMIKGKIKN